jgi:hypothetical protein
VKIELTVEEILEYQKFESELVGYQAGVADAMNFYRKRKIDAILKARKPEPEAQPDGQLSQ